MTHEYRPHPHLLVRDSGDLVELVLDNPDRLNAQTPSLWYALGDLAAGLGGDVRVVVLRGAGRSFSAGLDRRMLAPGGVPGEDDLLALAATDADAVERLIARMQVAFTAWRDCPAVVLAAVQGHAIGAGFQLALSADLRILADDAQLVMAETALGLVPDLGGTAALAELVGYPRALEICLTGRPVGAAEAVSLGLASLAVPRDALEATVTDLAAAIRQAPAAAVRATKALLAGASGRSRADQLAAERAAQLPLLRDLAAGVRTA